MNSKRKNELTIAYLQTEYSIDFSEERIWISPLSENLDFRRHIKKLKIQYWALVTPFNPKSCFLSDMENESRLKQFEHDELQSKKLHLNLDYFRSISKPKEIEVKGEIGFLIANIYPWEAVKVGHKWGQNAILVGQSDGLAELQWCDHESSVYINKTGR